MTEAGARIREVMARAQAAAEKAGRDPAGITLVGVSKTRTASEVNAALREGLRHFGENRVQEAADKLPLITESYAGFHFVGHLQSNKAKLLLSLNPSLIHSVDSQHLARALSHALEGTERIQDILLQVNTSGEVSKFGMHGFELPELARGIAKMPGLRIRGLMTIARLSEDPEEARADFKTLRLLAEQLQSLAIPKLELGILSMGMSNDFEIAIAEGATHIRIGSAVFGERTLAGAER